MAIGKTNATVIVSGETPHETGDYLVRYFDIDETILKEQWVNSGQNATPPDNPSHDPDRLIFNSWNQVSTNITSDKLIGATYDTIDNKTYAKIRLTTISGLAPTLYLWKSDTSELTIDWGDSTQSTFTNSENFNTGSHTYSSVGDYWIKIWISSGSGNYRLGSGSTSTAFVGGSVQNYLSTLLITYIDNKNTSIGSYAFYNCYSLTNISIPSSVTSIRTSAFYNCRSLTSISIPSSVTSIESNVFQNCYSILEYTIYATTPPTLSSTNSFTGINSICKIYVPDAALTAYKTATNWSAYAGYIYPLSQLTLT